MFACALEHTPDLRTQSVHTNERRACQKNLTERTTHWSMIINKFPSAFQRTLCSPLCPFRTDDDHHSAAAIAIDATIVWTCASAVITQSLMFACIGMCYYWRHSQNTILHASGPCRGRIINARRQWWALCPISVIVIPSPKRYELTRRWLITVLSLHSLSNTNRYR